MKKEIELKFFVDDLEPIRRSLLRIGAVKSWSGAEKDIFLDTPDLKLEKNKKELRIRRSGGKTLLTYKEHRASTQFKSMDEYQTTVQEEKEILQIFLCLGYVVSGRYTKPRREYWDLQTAAITLDSYPFGKFIEIEASERKIKELAKKLQLDFSRTSTKSYHELLEEHESS